MRATSSQLRVLAEWSDETDLQDEEFESDTEEPEETSSEDTDYEDDEDEVVMTIHKVFPMDDPARTGLHAGEKKEMIRRVVHWRTAATAIRPWKGPLPKVRLPNLTLFDLIRPDSWTEVKKKRQARRKVAAPQPAAAGDGTQGPWWR